MHRLSFFTIVLTHCYLLHLQHCSCFRDVVIDQIIGLHCIEVSSYDCCHQVSDSVAAIQVVQVVRCTRAHDPWGPTDEDQIAIF